jgi:hypothetical protein
MRERNGASASNFETLCASLTTALLPAVLIGATRPPENIPATIVGTASRHSSISRTNRTGSIIGMELITAA